jgi:hypothetical protein
MTKNMNTLKHFKGEIMTLSTYTHPNGTVIPLEEVCSRCRGRRFYDPNCPKCAGTGKTWIYYTPEQVKEMTGEKLLKNTAIWLRTRFKLMCLEMEWSNWNYWSLKSYKIFSRKHDKDVEKQAVVAFPYQPKPPRDWRPE